MKGLFLLTDYPAVTVRPGTASTVNLRLQNYALPPERLALTVTGVPSGWTATLLGGGQPVAAAMPATNQSVSLQLRLDVPAGAAMGTQTLTVTAKGGSTEVSLPVAVTLAKDLPAKLTLEPQLPSLRGNARSSFEYQLNVKNDSGRNLVVGFSAAGPPNFETSFTEQYGSAGAQLDAGRGRPVQDRQAEGAPADHDRRRHLSGHREGDRGRRQRRRQGRAGDRRLSRGSRSPAATAWCRAAPKPARKPRSRS